MTFDYFYLGLAMVSIILFLLYGALWHTMGFLRATALLLAATVMSIMLELGIGFMAHQSPCFIYEDLWIDPDACFNEAWRGHWSETWDTISKE